MSCECPREEYRIFKSCLLQNHAYQYIYTTALEEEHGSGNPGITASSDLLQHNVP